MSQSDDAIRAILRGSRTIAVVGLSADPNRPSHEVFGFLIERGYDCVGINPGLAGKTIQGAPVFADLASVDRQIDMVDVFRASSALGDVVSATLALRLRPKVLWTQLGVIDENAARWARDAGMTVVMDRCPKIEIARLFRSAPIFDD